MLADYFSACMDINCGVAHRSVLGQKWARKILLNYARHKYRSLQHPFICITTRNKPIEMAFRIW